MQNGREVIFMSVDLTKDQIEIILDAVEDYAILVDDDLADKCGEILDILESKLLQTNGNS